MREISIPGLAALLAFPLAACASVHEDYEGVGYTIYTDFRVESSVTDSEGLPEGAVGWFGSSPVYEEKSQHLSFFAFCKEHGAVDFVENPQKPGSFFGSTADGTRFALGSKLQSKDAINAVSDKDFIENYYFVEVRDKMDPEAQWFWALRSNNSANSVRRISIA